MVRRMKQGAVVVDMAADSGGNVAGTKPGETVVMNGVTIVGTINLASRMPVHASEMYARNLFNFISPFIKAGELKLDWDDEILANTVFTRNGTIRNERERKALGVGEK